MFMRRHLTQGDLFKLDRDNKSPSDQQMQSASGINVQQQIENQNNFRVNQISKRKPDFPQFNVEQMAMNNSAAIVCCGAIMCCLFTIIGGAFFYYFLYDYVKQYIPDFVFQYAPFMGQSGSIQFLTSQNAKRYFANNQLLAGQFHYARIPVEYWQHRIQTVKSMGLNALSVYVFWNYHQIQKGKFDFTTQNKNLPNFLQLARKHDMQVLLRPGPYVCAEWDNGGLPARLFSIDGLKIRSSNDLFIDETKIYFEELSKVIRKYVKSKNHPRGPILMIQVQNEPSWYTSQKLYIDKLKKLWDDIGIQCPLYLDDTVKGYQDTTLYWDNAIIAMNPWQYGGGQFSQFDNTNHFAFGGQVYAGWFTSWGNYTWEKQYVDRYRTKFPVQFSKLLEEGKSFSIYMVHGGTNFGLTAGYNYVTSYDYSAPISQQGAPTDNFHVFRSLLVNYNDKIPPKMIAPIQTMEANFGQPIALSSLFDNLPEPILTKHNPLIFESKKLQMYHQGMVLYETTIQGPKQYTFEVLVHDIALLYVDGEFINTMIRVKDANLQKEKKQITIKCEKQTCKLQILVQALGHANFGHEMENDRKGLLRFIEKQQDSKFQSTVLQWKHFKFNLRDQLPWKNNQKCTKPPCLFYIEANLQQAKDTYINLSGLKKGYVWVNGYNLGRYWDIGPQHSLYCPGVWLNKGKNKVLILDLYTSNTSTVIKSQNFLS